MEEDTEVSNSREEEQPPVSRLSVSRSNQARQAAVNFMPSRQLPYNTLRHRRHNSEQNVLLDETDNVDGEAEGGVEGAAENEDSEDQEQKLEEKKALIIAKELEQQQELMEDNLVSEELRREALRDLPQGLTMKRNVRAKLSASVSLRSKRRPISMFKQTKYKISFAWKRSKERIRDAMFSIELWYEAIRHIEGQFGSAVGSYFRMVRRLFLLNLALSVLFISFIVIPQAMHDLHTLSIEDVDAKERHWGVVDWITGQGYIRTSLMYYGNFHDGYIATGGLPYNMAFAYFFTMVCLYLVFFFVLCYGTAYSYRRNFIETAGGLSHVFANKVFCGWDFGIMSPCAAELNARSLYNELKELLSEQNKKLPSLTWCRRLCQRTVNVSVTVLVLGAVGGLLLALWRMLAAYSHWEVSLSALLIAIVSLCPVLFHLVGRLEYYSARTSLYVTLARTWLLDVSVLVLLLVYWARSHLHCWETRFGQEAYRLVLLDTIVSLLVLPAIEIFRALLYNFRPSGSPPEFNIAYNSLTLIYNQSVLWFGMLFSPLLAVVVTMKFLVLFYVKRECAVRACQPARKVWRAAQTQTVLYMFVTLSLFAALFGIGSIFLNMPSQQCGPFRAYAQVIGVLTEGVLRLAARPALSRALGALHRPGVLAAAALLLCVLVYYARARARAQAAAVHLLRHMLALQARDKDFLLAAIDNVANGEWLYRPKPESGPDSHTIRYLREVRKPSNSSYHFDGSRLSRSFADRSRDQSHNQPLDRSHNQSVNQSHDQSRRPASNDGDTDSSFSWRGSGNNLDGSVRN